jgi:hypothetical protein
VKSGDHKKKQSFVEQLASATAIKNSLTQRLDAVILRIKDLNDRIDKLEAPDNIEELILNQQARVDAAQLLLEATPTAAPTAAPTLRKESTLPKQGATVLYRDDRHNAVWGGTVDLQGSLGTSFSIKGMPYAWSKESTDSNFLSFQETELPHPLNVSFVSKRSGRVSIGHGEDYLVIKEDGYKEFEVLVGEQSTSFCGGLPVSLQLEGYSPPGHRAFERLRAVMTTYDLRDWVLPYLEFRSSQGTSWRGKTEVLNDGKVVSLVGTYFTWDLKTYRSFVAEGTIARCDPKDGWPLELHTRVASIQFGEPGVFKIHMKTGGIEYTVDIHAVQYRYHGIVTSIANVYTADLDKANGEIRVAEKLLENLWEWYFTTPATPKITNPQLKVFLRRYPKWENGTSEEREAFLVILPKLLEGEFFQAGTLTQRDLCYNLSRMGIVHKAKNSTGWGFRGALTVSKPVPATTSTKATKAMSGFDARLTHWRDNPRSHESYDKDPRKGKFRAALAELVRTRKIFDTTEVPCVSPLNSFATNLTKSLERLGFIERTGRTLYNPKGGHRRVEWRTLR